MIQTAALFFLNLEGGLYHEVITGIFRTWKSTKSEESVGELLTNDDEKVKLTDRSNSCTVGKDNSDTKLNLSLSNQM